MTAQYLGCLAVMALACTGLRAQNLTIHWPSRQFSGCPAEITRAHSVNVVVSEANTILYKYKVDIQETPRVISDFDEIKRMREAVEAASAAREVRGKREETACQSALKAVQKNLEATQKAFNSDAITLKKNAQGKYPSVGRDATEKAWLEVRTAMSALEESIAKLKAIQVCDVGTLLKEYDALKAKTEAFQKQVDGPRGIQVSTTLRPDNDYTITVTELYNGEITQDGQRSFECRPRSGILTLSAGYLLTTVEDRSYVRRSIPGAPAAPGADTLNPAQDILAVEGTGALHPTGVALLNYQIPELNREEWPVGVTISTGPTVKIGTNSDTAAFGLFAGVSLHLWRRLFLTPGWHVGEFADFPPEFYPGRIIPATITQLSPVKRWTSRFAFAITFRAASLANGSSSGTKKTGQ